MRRRTCTFLLAVLLLLTMVPTSLAAGSNGLHLTPAMQEGAIVVRVSLAGCQGATSGRIVLAYDPEVVTFERATPADGISISSTNDKGEDSVSFAWVASNLPEGEASVAELVFSVNDPKQGAIAAFAGTVSELYRGETPVALSAEEAKDHAMIACGTERKVPFTDIDGWAKEYIEKAYRAGLINGITDTTFVPNAKMTRAMFVTVLYRLAGEPEGTTTNPFADVAKERYYFSAVCWAYQKGIVKGVSETAFAPNQQITRQEMVTMLYRYAGDAAENGQGDLSRFPDAAAVSGWAKEAMTWAVAQGIIVGSDGGLQPTRDATRAEAVTVVCRFAGI